LAGENITTPAVTMVSTTERLTEEDAAPMMTSTFFAQQRGDGLRSNLVLGVAGVAFFVLDVLAEQAAGSLISWMASFTPANSGGPRKASEPVIGSSVPMVSSPSPSRVADDGNLRNVGDSQERLP
jgi:hypothetical protein